MKVTKGQLITVSGPAAGVCPAEVLEVSTPEGMPPIHDRHIAKVAAAIFRQYDVDQVALIRHFHEGSPVRFLAWHCDGRWFDLERQHLTITARSMGATL